MPSSLEQLPDETVTKILSYTQGGPVLYMHMASTCKRLYNICTTDAAWERFNVYRVREIHRHFLAMRDRFTERECALYHTPSESWSELLDSTGVDQLNPYTQLFIILEPMMFGSLYNQITDRRVMELGVLEPGNLIFYACDVLKMDPDLVRLSLKSRQHIGILPPKDWSTELKLNWHFAYANLDSEFQSPYPPFMHDCDLDPYVGDSFWSTRRFLFPLMKDPQTGLRIRYLTQFLGCIIKMGERYFYIQDSKTRYRLAIDDDFKTAALDSGVSIGEFQNPSMDLQIRAAARGGIQEARESMLPKDILLRHNSWALYRRGGCTCCEGPRRPKCKRPSGLFRRKELRSYAGKTMGASFRSVVAAKRMNANLCGNYCRNLVDERYLETEEFQRSEREAKLNGRYLRAESRKQCQIEWFLSRPVDRPFVQKDHPAVAEQFKKVIYGRSATLIEWFPSSLDDFGDLRERYPEFS